MRLFVAAQLPDELLDALGETSASLRSCVRGRFVGPDLFHVTLAFLGEKPAAEVPTIARAVELACEGLLPFHTTLGELGIFGRRSSAVLWQGFSSGLREWDDLARAMAEALEPFGYEPEHGRFVPHVTLMRRADVRSGTLPMPCVERGEVSSVRLFSSDLSGPRPRYRVEG